MIKQKHIPKNSIVRKQYPIKSFDKGYYPNWTDKTYNVQNIIQRKRPMYKIKNNYLLKQSFYPEELQVIKPTMYRIEKILRRRLFGNRMQYFVKWLNYPSSENSWIDANDVISL
ncbi:uncharacterized protein B4U80_09874 [Leptotrombidium deliense]|uniref:Chromo domain-containing protein n=1 Tax=Leptotrombidium deliense TaxID=299467 RepID=A0A443QBW3_9ACAR|nr:uncharacterized protein B4U80_09874 [Leptotrombidium deliense]